MTRGLYPPDTLSKDDIKTLADLRRNIWSSAMIGAGFGTASGFILHTSLQLAKKYGIFGKNSKYNKNTALLSILGCGALGMFLGATTTGKQQVHNLHPIFQVGAVPKKNDDELSSSSSSDYYRQTLQRARERGEDVRALEKSRLDAEYQKQQQQQLGNEQSEIVDFGESASTTTTNIDLQKMEQVRLLRRRSLMDSIEKGHGLSDSHGGHWYQDPNAPSSSSSSKEDQTQVDLNELERMRLVRRRSIMDSIEKGHGLSDSHGGHWYRGSGN